MVMLPNEHDRSDINRRPAPRVALDFLAAQVCRIHRSDSVLISEVANVNRCDASDVELFDALARYGAMVALARFGAMVGLMRLCDFTALGFFRPGAAALLCPRCEVRATAFGGICDECTNNLSIGTPFATSRSAADIAAFDEASAARPWPTEEPADSQRPTLHSVSHALGFQAFVSDASQRANIALCGAKSPSGPADEVNCPECLAALGDTSKMRALAASVLGQ